MYFAGVKALIFFGCSSISTSVILFLFGRILSTSAICSSVCVLLRRFRSSANLLREGISTSAVKFFFGHLLRSYIGFLFDFSGSFPTSVSCSVIHREIHYDLDINFGLEIHRQKKLFIGKSRKTLPFSF